MDSASISEIYLYEEQSARANALIRHIYKYNPNIIISHVIDNKLNNYNLNESNNYYFILNENGIQSFHEQYEDNINTVEFAYGYNKLNLVFPTLVQSYLEISKLYCRQFLQRAGLEYLNPQYTVLTKKTNLDMVKFANRVIKADGLAAGKGVFVYGDHFNTDSDAKAIVLELLEKHTQVLLEEKLEGEEFSCITLSWKGVMTHFPLIKDFKRLEDGDSGPNTGGMGTITFAGGSMPFLESNELEHCKSINETVIIESNFRGFLYGSFIKTKDGQLKIIEYNTRLGDSEAVNIMELLDSSLMKHLDDPVANPLVINKRENTYFRYLVPRDYARDNSKRHTGKNTRKNLHYLVDHNMPFDSFYLANSNSVFDKVYNIGTSRTCGVLSRNIDVGALVAENDRLVSMIYGDLHYRRDIGLKMLDMLKMYSHIPTLIIPALQIQTQDSIESRLNYIGHLDNYNHIITDVKKIIDTHNKEVSRANPELSVLGRIGDFANSVQLGGCKMICSVDGAGTKTKFLEGHPCRFDILGRDIVVHNINDMFCNNGRPIALLDYFGCDKLDKNEFAQFINGALSVCREYGITLIGGETAEMRGIFQTGEVEVLGILLGILEGDATPANGGNAINAGHIVYGLESHGAHTNGFTKLRDVASKINSICDGMGTGMPIDVREFFSQPHRCYVPVVNHLESILKKLEKDMNIDIEITGKAHITGGGFYDNIERILPDGLRLELETWKLDYAWQWLFDNAGMDWNEFIRVFNGGWGFCVVVNQEIPHKILADMEIGGYGKIKKLGKIL